MFKFGLLELEIFVVGLIRFVGRMARHDLPEGLTRRDIVWLGVMSSVGLFSCSNWAKIYLRRSNSETLFGFGGLC